MGEAFTYYLVDILDDKDGFCIKVANKLGRKPTKQEVFTFMEAWFKQCGYTAGDITNILPLTEEEADDFYDLSDSDTWPILGQ